MDQYDKGALSSQRHTEADAIGIDILQVWSHVAVPDWMDPNHSRGQGEDHLGPQKNNSRPTGSNFRFWAPLRHADGY